MGNWISTNQQLYGLVQSLVGLVNGIRAAASEDAQLAEAVESLRLSLEALEDDSDTYRILLKHMFDHEERFSKFLAR